MDIYIQREIKSLYTHYMSNSSIWFNSLSSDNHVHALHHWCSVVLILHYHMTIGTNRAIIY